MYKEDKFFYLYEANTEYKFCINELIEKGLIVEIKRINNIIEYFKNNLTVSKKYDIMYIIKE